MFKPGAMNSTITIEYNSLTSSHSKGSIIIPPQDKVSVGVPTEPPAQKARIWDWGVDESLWNPDRTRYAGRLPPLEGKGCKDNCNASNKVTEEDVKEALAWMERNEDMTEEEKAQNDIAMKALLESLEPLPGELIDEAIEILCD